MYLRSDPFTERGIFLWIEYCVPNEDPGVCRRWGHVEVAKAYPMGEILEFPKPNSARTRALARRAENFRSELCENICIDLRGVKLDTAPSEYTPPPDDYA